MKTTKRTKNEARDKGIYVVLRRIKAEVLANFLLTFCVVRRFSLLFDRKLSLRFRLSVRTRNFYICARDSIVVIVVLRRLNFFLFFGFTSGRPSFFACAKCDKQKLRQNQIFIWISSFCRYTENENRNRNVCVCVSRIRYANISVDFKLLSYFAFSGVKIVCFFCIHFGASRKVF